MARNYLKICARDPRLVMANGMPSLRWLRFVFFDDACPDSRRAALNQAMELAYEVKRSSSLARPTVSIWRKLDGMKYPEVGEKRTSFAFQKDAA